MIRDIAKTFVGLKVDENRTLRDDYAELVFVNKELAAWDAKLAESLGPAVKPSGTKPQPADSAITEKFGGIQSGQTLYRKDTPTGSVIAMLWPWRDDVHITLKLALVAGAPAAAPAAPAAAGGRAPGPAAKLAVKSGIVRKLLLWVGAPLVLLVAVFGIVAVVAMGKFEKALKATVIRSIDPTQVADGTYEGEWNLHIVSAKVIVSVAGGVITTISVVSHDHGPGYGGEAVIPRIIAAQSVIVDAVTGATGSSIVMRKAVEVALRKGLVPAGDIAPMGTAPSDTTAVN